MYEEYFDKLKKAFQIRNRKESSLASYKFSIPFAQHVLRILTGKDDLEIVSIETQADMKRLRIKKPLIRSTRL